MSAFAQLHPGIQKAVHGMKWTSLRPLQVSALEAILGGNAPLILSAATASGKTEAAFLPILSRIASSPADSVQAVHISPLKALINDQFHRLEELCASADIPVHRWHGDVSATAKQRLKREPRGVLLITPESMESQFCNHDRDLGRIYAHLEFVVIDELHAFLDDVRGVHLRSLLARLGLQAGVKHRLIGLSATLGDFTEACRFLNPSDPAAVKVLEDVSPGRELRIGVKSFYESPEDAGEDGHAILPQSALALPGGLAGVARDIALRFRKGTNLVFCNRRQDAEVLADKLNQTADREHWKSNPFVVHHGSLSKELREETETLLKSGEPITALCTSTLEMGIDIGSVRAIGQVDPPWRVASLVQRLGRCGRREGEAQVLRLYAMDREPTPKSDLSDRLHPALIRSIAMVELHLKKWLEPPERGRRHYSTCIHQILSILRQTGGASAATLHYRLCEYGAFRGIMRADFVTLLRGLSSHQIIEQIPSGDLILTPDGEKIVESRDFYAAFAGSVDYSVEHEGQKIGLIPLTSVPPVDEHFLLAGKRWRVDAIEYESRRVVVSRARGWKRPYFAGSAGEIHPRILQMMREVLAGTGHYLYLDDRATCCLQKSRKTFQEAGLARHSVITAGNSILWFTWQGGKVCAALTLAAGAAGLKASWDGLAVCYERTTLEAFRKHLDDLTQINLVDKIRAELCHDLVSRDRFDHLVDQDLLIESFLQERLDFHGVSDLAASAKQSLEKI